MVKVEEIKRIDYKHRDEIEKMKIVVDRNTLSIDEYGEESYLMLDVLDGNGNVVGIFQCVSDILNEEKLIAHYETQDPIEWMKKPYLHEQHKIIRDLHNRHMKSSNSNIYGDDFRDSLDTVERYGCSWEEYENWLVNHAIENEDFGNVFIEDDCETFWIGWDFLSNYNLLDK